MNAKSGFKPKLRLTLV